MGIGISGFFGNKNLEMQIFPNLFHMESNMGTDLGLSNPKSDKLGLSQRFVFEIG